MASLRSASVWRVALAQLAALGLIRTPVGWAPDATTGTGFGSKKSLDTFATVYNLDSGDRIRKTVFRQGDLSGEFILDGRGNLALPLVGEVEGDGKTLRELENKIEDAYGEGGFLVDPQIGIEVLSFRPFYLFGEVSHPGGYPQVSGMTGSMAVVMSGGFTYKARQSSSIVQWRADDTRRSVALANTVLPDDILNIEERFC